jgi:diaminopimelate decarboxylase
VSHGREAAKVDVVGPVCETGDFFARDRDIERVEAGALLAVRDTGAYGSAMASNYNMRMRPAEGARRSLATSRKEERGREASRVPSPS